MNNKTKMFIIPYKNEKLANYYFEVQRKIRIYLNVHSTPFGVDTLSQDNHRFHRWLFVFIPFRGYFIYLFQ